MENLKYAVGVDMAHKTFKACIGVIDQGQHIKIKSSGSFSNTTAGYKEFVHWVRRHHKEALPLVMLMEATGIYHEQLAWYLYEKGYKVSVVVPTKAKYYLRSLGIKTKNDKADAKGLAQMAAQQNLPLWQPISRSFYQLRALTRLLASLQNQKSVFSNQLHAVKQAMYPLKEVEKSLGQTIKHLEKQIQKVENTIAQTIEKDPVLQEKYEHISQIKGVGLLTFAVIVAETNGFALFENQRQLTSYAGYDIVERQSGDRRGKTRISKKGNAHIRRAMHLPAFNVVRYQVPIFADLYQRVYQGSGIKMKAYVAVQRKLLTTIYALWKKGDTFDPDYLKENNTSGTKEAKHLFPLGLEQDEKNSPDISRATLDELPYTVSAEALFPLEQS
jgi:transposase